MGDYITRQIAVSTRDRTVLIKLICGDVYGAEVLCSHIQDRLASGKGFSLKVKAEPMPSRPSLGPDA